MTPEQRTPEQSWPTHWPKVARDIADATADALAAVRAANRDGLLVAVEELRGLSFEQVSSVHAAIVRELLEDTHPDGLSSEDVQDALTACAKSTIVWLPDLDVQALAAVYTGRSGSRIWKTIRSVWGTARTCVRRFWSSGVCRPE